MKTEIKFCAFIDVLGFKKIIDNWVKAEEYYETLVMKIFPMASNMHTIIKKGVIESVQKTNTEVIIDDLKWRIFSDSIIITTSNPIDLIQISGNIQYYSFLNSFWTRGGFAFGRHMELSQDPNYFVVSEALSAAYTTESKVSKDPRIVIHESAIDEVEKAIFSRGSGKLLPIESKFLVQSADDKWFLNPFVFRPEEDIEIFVNSINEKILEHKNTEFIDKYLWVGDLHNFITSHKMLADSKCWNNYYSNSEEYTTKLKEINEKNNHKIFVNTWDYSKTFNNFFLPRVPTFSPFTQDIDISIENSPYKLSFKENVTKWKY